MFKVSVPGSLMLFGEHAVLKGKMAIVMAINARLQMTLIPNNLHKIIINSDLVVLEINLNDLSDGLIHKFKDSKLNYVLTSIWNINRLYRINSGFNLIINNQDLKSNMGFGSSAAIVIGSLMIISKFLNLTIENQKIFNQALKVIHQVQDGLGSGADLAASLYGGIIAYQNFKSQKILNQSLDLVAIYCGYKVKTAEVIKIISQQLQQDVYKELYTKIFNSMQAYSKLAIMAIEKPNLKILGKILNIGHGLMNGLGLVDNNLDQIATNLRACSTVYGAKISGAGLGDCVIGLGKLSEDFINTINHECFTLQTSTQGVIWL
ncbi:MAG: mevalonate kinase family protein [Gammaproteobacteria bacterium]